MEQNINIQTPRNKIYKDQSIWIGSLLGGPLAAGYLIAENFKAFNETEKANKTWIYTIIATVVIFGSLFMIPEGIKIPNLMIPLIYTAIAYFLVQHFQGERISAHINSGGQFHSWWRTITVGLIGLSITSISVVCIALFSDATSSVGSDTKLYGLMKHEISFDKNNISESEINKIADGLIKTSFFDDAVTKYVYVKNVNNNFELFISCDKSVTSSKESLEPFLQLRKELQTLFPENKIIFNLVVDNLDNIVKRLE